jgi:NAD(P)H-flavin reductase
MIQVADPMRPRPFVVRKNRVETHDTFTLELEPADGQSGFAFRPGQFNMVYLFGVGEVPVSISGDPANQTLLVHTIRAVGTVTRALQKVRRGDPIGIRGPYGTHWPVEEATGNDVLIVAGGIGLAPLRPVMYHVHSHREKFGKVVLLYGARTPEDLLFRPELETWRAHFDLEVQVTVDRARGPWRGNVGVVPGLIARASLDFADTVAMIVGLGVMMRFTVAELLDRGVPSVSIFLSMERAMKCGVGLCGNCQFGPLFICKDGPVFSYERVRGLLGKREL